MPASILRKAWAVPVSFPMACLHMAKMCIAYVVVNFLIILPIGWKPKTHKESLMPNLNISFKTVLQVVHTYYLRTLCPLKVGLPAPNINILTLDGVKKKLLDFEKKGRPLVVNFGSCT